MGNCQAAEAATVIIQQPGGKVDRLYWPTSAADVMKSNPGYHVALATLYVSSLQDKKDGGGATVRFTRVRLLNPKDMLLLGQVYCLITNQEVAKAIRARKLEKMKKNEVEMMKQQQLQQKRSRRVYYKDVEIVKDAKQADLFENSKEVTKQERDHHRSCTQTATRKPRHWHPSLQSISESAS